MKIKLDENLPIDLVPVLQRLGHDVDTVPQENLTGSNDTNVWKATQAAGRFLITQDMDFSDSRKYKPGSHCGLLLLRLMDPSRQNLLNRILTVFETVESKTWGGCNVVVTDKKTRVVRADSGLN